MNRIKILQYESAGVFLYFDCEKNHNAAAVPFGYANAHSQRVRQIEESLRQK
jgi:hypothetical protein